MELRQLQSLVAVIRYQSFTKAAEELYISQPTISTHIRMLEEEFQTRLIIRTTKSIQATEHGMELYECACKMLALKEDLVKRWAEENQKIIRLGASTIPADYILPEILPVFREKVPDIQFHIYQSDSKGIIEGVLSGKFALGMVGMDSGENAVEFLPFYRDKMVMIAPVQEHFQKIRGPEELLEAILREPVILREQGSGSKKCMEEYFEHMGIREKELHVTARLNDQESIKKLVAGGLGISFISEKAVEQDKKEGKLLSFELPQSPAVRSLYLACRKDYMRKPHVEQFMEFLLGYYERE